ncbi:hypothetical protein EYF80_061243 [Liparis tanakae]|uniref:Uncharacterized protein n=1 Tax=Liparis tanakae TaxID=230148 RepID=A0A4Z2EII4_9TELE|nr:hypothetical protein EYF80_061243 [Liparis tanakae]
MRESLGGPGHHRGREEQTLKAPQAVDVTFAFQAEGQEHRVLPQQPAYTTATREEARARRLCSGLKFTHLLTFHGCYQSPPTCPPTTLVSAHQLGV